MNRRLVLGALSGLAAIGLAVGGTTYSAFTDFGQVDGNIVGAGFLKLDLGADGRGDAAIDFAQIVPGVTTDRRVWVASHAGGVPQANLYLTLHNLADQAGPCDTSRGKATGESESGISGCTVSGDAVSGTPAQGNLSRVLSIEVADYSDISSAAECATVQDAEPHNVIMAAAPGNLHTSAAAAGGQGIRYQLRTADEMDPLRLAPGAGVCVGIAASWPPDNNPPGRPSRDYPSDNAAQGDSLRVDIRFDLIQAP